ncbi:MAG: sulfatase [Actinomycetota bacterium]|nr:sulfatase [Actinomycetota bacterium]
MRILYVDVDTLRADHTGPYGYRRAITPNLDALAAEAAVLDRCYASDSPCAPSRAALTSGQFGITTGAIANFGPAADIRMFDRTRYGPTFGGHLYRNGIYTASISCFPERHMAYWFLGNFREWLKPSLSNGDDEDAAAVTDAAVDWLVRKGRADNWFLQVHFWDPHIPYVEPTEWCRRAADAGDPPDWPDEEAIAAHAEIYGPHTALDLYEGDGSWSVPPPPSPNPATMPDAIRTRDDAVQLINGYDGAIAYWDHHLGRLMDTLNALGIAEETAVIVASDHGECLGENGCYGDHPMANEPSHHVPMVIRWPGMTTSAVAADRRSSGLVYHLDLAPTVCELLGIEVPAGWDGSSFAPVLRGEPFAGRDHLVLSHGAYTYQRAVRTADHLYVRTLHPGCWRLEPEQLYDIEADPHMTRDLLDAGAGPTREHGQEADAGALSTRLARLLEEWRQDHLTLRDPDPDPMEARRYESPADAFSVPAYQRRLEATGRAHLADDLRRRLSSEWVVRRRW